MGKGGGCVPSKQKTSRKRSSDASTNVKDNAPVPMEDSTTQGSTPLQASALPPSSPPNLKLFIIFYSMYGHVELLARKMKKGVDGIEGVEGVLYRVPETLPAEVLEQMKAPEKDESIPVVSAEELVDADGILFGFPTRYGSMAAQMKAFFDSTGQLWKEQKLAGSRLDSLLAPGLKEAGRKRQRGPQSLSWPTTECSLFRLVIHLGRVCSRWTTSEGALLMVQGPLPEMEQENPAKWSSPLPSTRASTWLQWSSGLGVIEPCT